MDDENHLFNKIIINSVEGWYQSAVKPKSRLPVGRTIPHIGLSYMELDVLDACCTHSVLSSFVSDVEVDVFRIENSCKAMTVVEFFGCAFLAFGPPLAMFVFTIAIDPIRIIILMASSFFWLLSLLLSSSIFWFVIPSQHLSIGLFISVLFQELFRFIVYKVLRSAEGGLKKITDDETQLIENKHILAYVAGLGFGVMSGMFSLINVLADSVGPGTMGLIQGSEKFFMTSAATTLCFILLHTFWGIIFFSAVDCRSYINLAWVIVSHLVVSGLSFLNQKELHLVSILPSYVIMVMSGFLAFKIVGGSFLSFRASLKIHDQIE